MSLKKIIFLSLLPIFIGFFSIALREKKSHYAEHVQFDSTLGKEGIEVLLGSARVGAIKITRDKAHNFSVGDDKEKHFLTEEQSSSLKKLLIQDKGYHFNRHKKCVFIPEIAFTFANKTHAGQPQLVIMVSILCNQIKIIENEKTVILDYDPMAEDFNSFCRILLNKNK